ncbi:hypothetical protein Hte_005520 [Hypoxylon texense]
MSDLSLGSSAAAKAKNVKSLKAAQVVADSWEDEDVESDTESSANTQTTQPLSPSLESESPQILHGSGFAAPPPTPSSPSYSNASPQPPWQPLAAAGVASPPGSPVGGGGLGEGGVRRPEKTDAVARRMIASALGVRAPRATEEQRAYDRAVREKERKRREEEREAERKRKEEAERAKAAIWDD